MAELTTFSNTSATLEVSSGYLLGLSPDTNRVVTDIRGWYRGAAFRRDSASRMAAHGNFSERGFRDARYPSISGMFIGSTRAEAAAFVDEINAYLGDGTEGTLTITDTDLGTRSAKVYLLAPDVAWDGGLEVEFHLDMEAPDPRKYGDPVTASALAPKPGGGLIFPLFNNDPFGSSTTGALSFGTPGESGLLTLSNTGTAESPVTATVTGPVGSSGFTITHLATGRKLVYTAPVIAGQYVVLDSRTGTVKLNGYADRAAFLVDRDWIVLGGGETAKYLFEAPDSPEARLTLEVAPAWW